MQKDVKNINGCSKSRLNPPVCLLAWSFPHQSINGVHWRVVFLSLCILQVQLGCYSLKFSENIFIISSWRGIPTYACEMLSLQVCWERYDPTNIGRAVFFFLRKLRNWFKTVFCSVYHIQCRRNGDHISLLKANCCLWGTKNQVGMLTSEERGWATVWLY